MQPCNDGKYQNQALQEFCLDCPVGRWSNTYYMLSVPALIVVQERTWMKEPMHAKIVQGNINL